MPENDRRDLIRRLKVNLRVPLELAVLHLLTFRRLTSTIIDIPNR